MPKYVPSEHVSLLLGQPDASRWTGRRDHLALLLMLRCGLRVTECYRLRRSQVRRRSDHYVLNVREGKATVGKSSKRVRPRDIPTPPDVTEALDAWLAESQPDSTYLLPTRTGKPVHRVDAYKMVRRMAEGAGLDETWPHKLRHTFASDALDDGFTLAEVSRLLGHANLRSTAVYLHARDERIAGKMKGWNRGRTQEGWSESMDAGGG